MILFLLQQSYINENSDVMKSLFLLKYKEYNFFLTHYPKEVEKGEICIYGHVHDKKEELSCRSFCVCAEQINYTPIEIDELIRRI